VRDSMPVLIEAPAAAVDLWHLELTDRSTDLRAQHDEHLRRILSYYQDVTPSAWAFEKDRYGKPWIAGPKTNLHFSVSHSANHLLLGVSLINEFGVDIELTKEDLDIDEIKLEVFSSRELQDWNRDRSAIDFYATWVIKESYLKAKGVGLHQSPQSVSVRFGLESRCTIGDSGDDEMAGWHGLVSKEIGGATIGVVAYLPFESALRVNWRHRL